MNKKVWTDEGNALLLADLRDATPMIQISAKHQCSVAAIRTHRSVLVSDMYAAGATVENIAKQTGQRALEVRQTISDLVGSSCLSKKRKTKDKTEDKKEGKKEADGEKEATKEGEGEGEEEEAAPAKKRAPNPLVQKIATLTEEVAAMKEQVRVLLDTMHRVYDIEECDPAT